MTFLIEFLGCKVNSYEVEAIAKDFLDHGYKLFDKNVDDAPTVVIINTCAVTETSVTKDKKTIRKFRKLYPEAIIFVMGCYSQYKADYIINELNADIAIGTSHRTSAFELVENYRINHQKVVLHDEHNSIKKYENISVSKFLFNTRAYVKIQDGCNNFCSYCLIPYVRGRSRSRKNSDIIDEIKTLVANGHKEIVLTGIDMSSYGLDLNPSISFSDLIENIIKNVPELYRLRISSLEESQIDTKFLELLSKYDVLADHLHIPLQSGSEAVVKKMNRKYNLDSFIEKVDEIRKIRPNIAITTDVIVGFPGETEENFLETFKTCKRLKFSKIHVFPYSNREGTIASKMKEQIPQNIKKDRVHRLLDLSSELEKEYTDRFIGKDIEFLFEEFDPKLNGFKGHSSNYLECFVVTKENLQGKTKICHLTEENIIHQN